MNIFEQISAFIRAILGHLFTAFSRIEIDDESSDHLVLDVNTRKIILDKQTRTVSSSNRLLAKFEVVRSIDIEHHNKDDKGECWVLNLHLTGDKYVRIGKTKDGLQASISAAHISTITGKDVRALSKY